MAPPFNFTTYLTILCSNTATLQGTGSRDVNAGVCAACTGAEELAGARVHVSLRCGEGHGPAPRGPCKCSPKFIQGMVLDQRLM